MFLHADVLKNARVQRVVSTPSTVARACPSSTSSELDDVLAEVHRLHDIEQQLCDKDVELSIQTDKAQRLEAQLASRRSWVLSRAEREQAARERNPQWRPPARHAQTPVKNFSEFQSLVMRV